MTSLPGSWIAQEVPPGRIVILKKPLSAGSPIARPIKCKLQTAVWLIHNTHHSRYCETLDSVQEKLHEFRRQLGISKEVEDKILQRLDSDLGHDDKVKQLSREIDWKYEWGRVRVSWASKDLQQIIDDIGRLNKKLRLLLKDGEELGTLEEKRQSTKSMSIFYLREQATALYNFLAKQWPCECSHGSPSHRARVFLRHKPAAKEEPSDIKTLQDVAPFEVSILLESVTGEILRWQGPLVCSLQKQAASSKHIDPINDLSSKIAHMQLSEKADSKSVLPKRVGFVEQKAALPTEQDKISVATLPKHHFCMTLSETLSGPTSSTIGPFIEGRCPWSRFRVDPARRLILPAPKLTLSTGPTRLHWLTLPSPSLVVYKGPTLVLLSEMLSVKTSATVSSRHYTKLSLTDRVRLAVDVASSFFHLFGTPWVRRDRISS